MLFIVVHRIRQCAELPVLIVMLIQRWNDVTTFYQHCSKVQIASSASWVLQIRPTFFSTTTDWLIDCCLTSSVWYSICMHDDNCKSCGIHKYSILKTGCVSASLSAKSECFFRRTCTLYILLPSQYTTMEARHDCNVSN